MMLTHYKEFSFPLNVYTYVQLLQEGNVDYLHYGIYESDNDSLPVAQNNATEMLLSRLPSEACRILEVGIGFGKTLDLLDKRGHQVLGITPDRHQYTCARNNVRDESLISCCRFEGIQGRRGGFDRIIFQESAQYIDPITIMQRAQELLAVDGEFIIMDEFALRRTESGIGGLHLKNDFNELAKRFGFELVEDVDLSKQAVPTVDYLLEVIPKYRSGIQNELGVNPEQLADLETSNIRYREKYSTGCFGYALLRFRKKEVPELSLGEIDDTNSEEMRTLFEKVFNQQMSREFWTWKYAGGRGCAIGGWKDGRLVAHYGGLKRDVYMKGEHQAAVQIVDVMVDAKGRSGLTRQGPFFKTAATFCEKYVGYGKPYLMGFGFPNDRAMKVAARMDLYDEVDRIVEIVWPAKRRSAFSLSCVTPIESAEEGFMSCQVDSLWRQMSANLPDSIVGVRDWSYLQHRYINHPEKEYRVLICRKRFTGRPEGVLVCRPENDRMLILDIIAPLAHFANIISHAKSLAAQMNLETVYTWTTQSHSRYFLIEDGEYSGLNLPGPNIAWCDGPEFSERKDAWWLTSGDTDFM